MNKPPSDTCVLFQRPSSVDVSTDTTSSNIDRNDGIIVHVLKPIYPGCITWQPRICQHGRQ